MDLADQQEHEAEPHGRKSKTELVASSTRLATTDGGA